MGAVRLEGITFQPYQVSAIASPNIPIPCIYWKVIHRWFPERLVGDPPFMFGNQDSFTIFSPVYGFLMSHLSVDVAAMVITLVIQLVFAVAMILFIRSPTSWTGHKSGNRRGHFVSLHKARNRSA